MVTIDQVNGINVYTRSGAAEYYARIKSLPTGLKTLVDIGYTANTITTPDQIIVPNPMLLAGRTMLEGFLLTLYSDNINFVEVPETLEDSLKLYEDEASIASQYDTIKIADFLILTGAKNKYYTDANGVTQDLTKLILTNPTATRPAVVDLKNEDSSKMKSIVKHLGLRYFIKHLYVLEAIDFDCLVEFLDFFFPDDKINERNTYVYGELIPFSRNLFGGRMTSILSNEQLKQLKVL